MKSRPQHIYEPTTGPGEIEAQPNFTIKVISGESTPLLLLRTLAWA